MKPINTSEDSSFWEEYYQAENRPWEFYEIPEVLTSILTLMKPTGRVLLPGCGSAYEMTLFLEAGWDAWGIDFSETAVKRAKKNLQKQGHRILFGDFFTYPFKDHFHVIYERSFLCALPPQLRQVYAHRIKDLLIPRGQLIGFFLYGEAFNGPPFPLQDIKEAKKLFSGFELTEDLGIENSSSLSGGKERWEQWQKKLQE